MAEQTRITARVVADKGYNSGKIRGYLRRRGIGIVIPRQSHQRTV
jgi:hypothetical protein